MQAVANTAASFRNAAVAMQQALGYRQFSVALLPEDWYRMWVCGTRKPQANTKNLTLGFFSKTKTLKSTRRRR